MDDYPLKFSGERPTLVICHTDRKGVISELAGILYQKGFNIARMAIERSKINGPAITVCEIDNKIEEAVLALLKKEISMIDEIAMVQTK
ncbi:ACT domain-containing protein [Neobacillus driksii]|uniref:ACT domain-containing protein n=1 Tax=Neobacillus driksii TaxID=3035913 RepID=UPI0035BC244B